MSLVDLEHKLRDFMNLPSVIGLVLQLKSDVVISLFPKTIGSNRVARMCENIYMLWRGYEQAARTLNYICFEFDGTTLLTVWHENAIISFSCHGVDAAEMLATTAGAFLSDNLEIIKVPSPNSAVDIPAAPEEWKSCISGIVRILQRVISEPQAMKLIERVVQRMHYNMKEGIPRVQFRELALEITLEIPNRSKQAALKADLLNMIENL